jgi:hypothetical protein
MSIADGVIAGLVAGIAMGLASHVGYRLGLFKSSLLVIDGSFALRFAGGLVEKVNPLFPGIPIHLVTSIVFGIIYYLIVWGLDLDGRSAAVVAPYACFLWLAMLFGALPAAGQGVMGSKLAGNARLEQLILHIIFGLVLWGMMQAL